MNLFAELRYLLLLIPFILTIIAAVYAYLNVSKWKIIVLEILTLLSFVNLLFSHIYHGAIYLEFSNFEILNSTLSFKTEPLSLVFTIMVAILVPITHLYSFDYMSMHHPFANFRKYNFILVLSVLCSYLLAFSANLPSLFIFYEILTLFTYILVSFNNNEESLAAGNKYLMHLFGTSILFLLPAIILTYHSTGSTEFVSGGLFDADNKYVTAALLLFFFGIGKYAIWPFHSWLPAAMIAPTPVSALLHAVIVVKVGLYSFFKVAIYIFGIKTLSQLTLSNNIIEIFASITILVSTFFAFQQDSIKKMLAYSTISQLSYSIIALIMATPSSVFGAIFQMIAHGFAKITLFLVAGNIYTISKKTKISEITGVAHRMSFNFIAFVIASMSICGMPITAGFISKLNILTNSFESQKFVTIFVLLTSTLITMTYFSKMIIAAYSCSDDNFEIAYLSKTRQFIPIFTAIITIMLSFSANYLAEFLTPIFR